MIHSQIKIILYVFKKRSILITLLLLMLIPGIIYDKQEFKYGKTSSKATVSEFLNKTMQSFADSRMTNRALANHQ